MEQKVKYYADKSMSDLTIDSNKILKITQTTIKNLKIEAKGLDLINVYLENVEQSKGRIIIECYGKVWATFFNGMGDNKISEFFLQCSNESLIERFDSKLESEIVDGYKLPQFLKGEINKQLANGDIDEKKANHYLNGINCIDCIPGNEALFLTILGDDWEYAEFPMMKHPGYKYLERIINAVKEALKELRKNDLWIAEK